MIDRDAMPLAEAVTRLLSDQVQFRCYVADGEPSTAQIDIHLTDCWKCRRQFAVCNVAELQVTGRCTRNDYAVVWNPFGPMRFDRHAQSPIQSSRK